MTSRDSIIFDPKAVLWRSRGYYWGFEFINIPNFRGCGGWWKLTKDTFRSVDSASDKQIIYGTVDFRELNQRKWYLAAYFLDKTKVDWTSRFIRHFFIWFPPNIFSKEQLYQCVPIDWFEQIFEETSDFLYQDEIFRISESQLKELSHNEKDFHAYLQERYAKQVKRFSFKSKLLNSLPLEEWQNIDLIKE